MTAYARLRSSSGYGLRKIDRHTGLRRMLWSTRSNSVIGGDLPMCSVAQGHPAVTRARTGVCSAARYNVRRYVKGLTTPREGLYYATRYIV